MKNIAKLSLFVCLLIFPIWVNAQITNPLTITNLAGAIGILASANGGTGVNNGTSLITLGRNFTTTPANNLTLTTIAPTNVTLPSSGTLQASQSMSFQPGLVTAVTNTKTAFGKVVKAATV